MHTKAQTVNKDRKAVTLIQNTIGPLMLDLLLGIASLLFLNLKLAPPVLIRLRRYGSIVFSILPEIKCLSLPEEILFRIQPTKRESVRSLLPRKHAGWCFD